MLLAVVVDLSGPGRDEGQQVRNGARLALRHARRAGQAASRIELLVQDHRGDPARAARLARLLASVEEVIAVIGPADPASVTSVLREYERGSGVPTLLPAPLAPELSGGREWAFGMAPAARYLGEILGWFLVTELKADSAASFFSTDTYARALEQGFFAEVERLGGRAVARVPVDPSGSGLDSLVIAARDAPALLVAARGSPAARLVEALRRTHERAPILAGEPPALSSARAPIYYPLLFDPLGNPAAREFAADFERSFGAPPRVPAALAYDAASLVLRGVAGGARDRPALRDWLARAGRTAPHTGVTGKFFFSRAHDAVRNVTVAAVGATAPLSGAAE